MIARPVRTISTVRFHISSRTRFETFPTKTPAEISSNQRVKYPRRPGGHAESTSTTIVSSPLHSSCRRRPLVAWVGWLLVTTIVIGTVRTLVEIAGQHIALSGPDLLGLAQRLTLSAGALFIAWVALDLPAAAPRPRMPRTSSS